MDINDCASGTSSGEDNSSCPGLVDAQHSALMCALGSLAKDELHYNQTMVPGEENHQDNNDLDCIPVSSLERSSTTQQRLENPAMQEGRDAAVQLAMGSSSDATSDNDGDDYQIFTTMEEERLQQKLAGEDGSRRPQSVASPLTSAAPPPQPGSVRVGDRGDVQSKAKQNSTTSASTATTPGAVRVGGNDDDNIKQNSKAKSTLPQQPRQPERQSLPHPSDQPNSSASRLVGVHVGNDARAAGSANPSGIRPSRVGRGSYGSNQNDPRRGGVSGRRIAQQTSVRPLISDEFTSPAESLDDENSGTWSSEEQGQSSSFCVGVSGELVDDNEDNKARVRDEIRHQVRQEINDATIAAKVLDDLPDDRRRKRYFGLLLCAILVSIAIVVGVTVGMDLGPDEDPIVTQAPSFSQTQAPSSQPTLDAESRLFQVLDEASELRDDIELLWWLLDDTGQLARTWLLSDEANGTVLFLSDPATQDWQILQLLILTRFYFAMNDLQLAPSLAGEKLLSRANFLSSADVCTWNDGDLSGVFCSSDGRVDELQFSSLGLSGGCLPADFSQLTGLRELWLHSNTCTGTIPSLLGILGNLQVLSLDSNGFTGTVPTELGQLSRLNRFLFLADNDLSGTIPTEFGNLSALKGLHMNRNRFTGPLPSELGSFRRLERLELFSNAFTGSVPSEYGGMIRLQEINLVSNRLSGSLPMEMLNSNLKSIRISENEFSGRLPTTEFGVARNLQELDLDDNRFSGELPTELGLLTRLQTLSIRRNEFTGTIPIELSFLSNLDDVFLEGNSFTGDLGALFCNRPTPRTSVVVDCCLDGDVLACSCCACSNQDHQNGCG